MNKQVTKKILGVFCVCALLTTSYAHVAAAQDSQASAESTATRGQKAKTQQDDTSDLSPIEKKMLYVYEKAAMPQDDYVKATLENITNLYWKFGFWNVADPENIDDYLLVHECDIYKQYYTNEFEWRKIRDTAKKKIIKDVDEFTTKFEIVSEIALGKYNIDQEYFEITPETQSIDVRNVELAENNHATLCSRKDKADHYPQNIAVQFISPINLVRVPVFRELAERYIEDTERSLDQVPDHIRLTRQQRPAFVRLRVKLKKFISTRYSRMNRILPVFQGEVVSIEVYADQDLKKPLYLHRVTRGRR